MTDAVLKSHDGYYLWLYIPNQGAGGFFCALFALGAIYITWLMCRDRAWFCVVFIIGCLLEAIGYAARAAATYQTDALMPYIIQSTLLLVAPAFFAASVYMVLGRVIRSCGSASASLSLVPVRWLTPIFVTGDVLSFFVQAGGAGIMVSASTDPSSVTTGENVILAGLVVQILTFGFFAVTAAVFHVRVRRYRPGAFHGKQGGQAAVEERRSPNLQRIMVMLYVVSGLIMVRSVFRVVEYAGGQHGYLLANEWPLYVFDALLMFCVVVAFAWIFPGRLRAKGFNEYADRLELVES